MIWLEKFYNRTRVPGFLINSLPKSGTHLLEKMTRLVPGIEGSDIFFAHESAVELCRAFPAEEIAIPVGVSWPVMVPRAAIAHELERIEHGTFAMGHIPYSRNMAELVASLRIKSLTIIRDPRDVALSLAKYVPTVPDNALYPLFAPLSEPERITLALTGRVTETGQAVLKSMREAIESVVPWSQEAINYTTYFERLVGPKGGGTREAQIREVEHILHHLGIWHSSSRVECIADDLFGGSRTFNKGAIGYWKNCYTPEHIRLAKELLGDILIRLGYEQGMDW